MKGKFSFRYKLLLSFLLISTVPLFIVSMLVLRESNRTLEKSIIDSNLNFVEQAGINIEQTFTQVNELSLFIFQDKDIYAFLQLPDDVSNEESDSLTLKIYRTLMFFMNRGAGITSIFIEGENGLSFSINPLNQNQPVLTENILRTVEFLDGDALWRADSSDLVSQSRLIKDYYNLNKVLGHVSIQLRAEDIIKNFSLYGNDSGNNYYLFRNDNEVFMASGDVPESLVKTILPEMIASKLQSGYFYDKINGERSLVFFTSILPSDMILFWTIPFQKVELYDLVVNQVTIATLIMIVISIFMAVLFSRSFFLPLKTLGLSMHKVENEQFEIRIPNKRNDEIGSLILSFNNMAQRLDELHNEVYLAQVKEKEAELIALENQINPHFLYNTLDTIYWMTKLEGSVESARMIKTLANLFRISLSSGKEKIPLKKEIEHLSYYMEIQTRRFSNSFSYTLHMDPGLEEIPVLKLILQPLVENAIIHGIEKKADATAISVTIKKSEENELVYRIIDDGAGFSKEHLIQYKKTGKGGYGMKNVDDRLQLAYGPQYKIEIISEPGFGTEVFVKQPLRGIIDERSDC